MNDTRVPLSGGVASDICVVGGPDDRQVVKRALSKLRVEADWYADPSRSMTEVAAIRTASDLLGEDVVPKILWVDAASNSFGMEYIDNLPNWKTDLLRNIISLRVAERAGTLLGRLHERSSHRSDIAKRFEDTTFFRQLRIDPFFVKTAQKQPLLADAILGTVKNMETHRSALVHGDYSPKNLLADERQLVILDWEVAHWGDPRFDVAFCISHLLLKAHRRQADQAQLFSAILAFGRSYVREHSGVWDRELNRLTGCLLLARLVGSSPVEYLPDLDCMTVQNIGEALILGKGTSEAASLVETLGLGE